MNAYRLITVIFATAAISVEICAVVAIARSTLRYKAFWIIGSLFGFIGIGINWTKANNIFIEFGVQIPIIVIRYYMPRQEIATKIMFPVIAIIALIRLRTSAEPLSFVTFDLDEAE